MLVPWLGNNQANHSFGCGIKNVDVIFHSQKMTASITTRDRKMLTKKARTKAKAEDDVLSGYSKK